MTFTYTGAWKCPSRVQYDRVGGKQSHLQMSSWLTRLTDGIFIGDNPNSWPHCPGRAIQASKKSCGPGGCSKPAAATEANAKLAPSTSKHLMVTLKSAGAWSPWWAMMGVNLTLCGFFPNHQLLKAEDGKGGGSGRLKFLLSSGGRVPSVENTTFWSQFQVLLGVRQAPLPYQLCLKRTRVGQPWPPSATQKLPEDRGNQWQRALAL